MDWRDIPSLAALRAFEASARLNSFSEAARELNVTHAAIAQHIRTLSDHYGLVLMERQGNRMIPTSEGQRLAAGLSEGFLRIAEASRDLSHSHETRPLTVTTTINFAENWIMPRLSRFWSEHPDIPLTIKVDNTVLDLRQNGFDMAIRYGRGNWPGQEAQILVPADFSIVTSPEYLQHHPEIGEDDYRNATWLFEETHLEAQQWVEETGYVSDTTPMQILPTSGSLRAALSSGAGVALLFTPMLGRDLENGQLHVLERVPQDGLGYYIISRAGGSTRAQTEFIKWLRKEAAS
ncbi:LysR family transcriptional regulator, glycine cleavage system transcriptional activator [Celeribacter neptunius]|uniref:LysR family transcriptional regulator, glycine cleavage system transcriptional activator n=2 Tax=Celeribacter neptunius TaxID=588602 RepID=A0A1I3SJ04_9RHOB|nr:LysR family transcriptional regulator, glycine cleavage system transcriptional activator [Celeribacter neptunius]